MESAPYLLAVAAGVVAGLQILAEARPVRVVLLAIQYLIVALLSAQALPFSVALVKWVAGLMSCGILALTFTRLAGRGDPPLQEVVPAGRWFRLLSTLLVAAASLGLGRTDWLGVPEITPAANLGSSLLMGLGLLQIGLSQARLRVGIGLMTLISGFEIAYCVVEPSLAVLALLGSIHIGLAMVISYLLIVPPSGALGNPG